MVTGVEMEGIGDGMDGGRIDVVYGRLEWDGWMEREEEIGGDGAEGGSGRGGRLCLYTRAGRTGRGCTISKPQCTYTHTRSTRPRTRTCPGPLPAPPAPSTSCPPALLHPASPFPSPQERQSNKVRPPGHSSGSSRAWELRAGAAQPSIIPPPVPFPSPLRPPLSSPSLYHVVPPETLPCLGPEPV